MKLSKNKLNTLVTAISAFVVTALGGVTGLLIIRIFGKTPQTDAFFVAFSIFSFFVLFFSTFRFTLVPKIVTSGNDSSIEKSFAKLNTRMFLLILMLMVGLFWSSKLLVSVAGLDLEPESYRLARKFLVLMIPAIIMQGEGFLLASYFGGLEKLHIPALALALGALNGLIAFLVFHSFLGLYALLASIYFNSFTLVSFQLYSAFKNGYQVYSFSKSIFDYHVYLDLVKTSVLGASIYLFQHLNFIITQSLASFFKPGSVTLYDYSYYLMGLMVVVVNASIAITLAPNYSKITGNQIQKFRDYIVAGFRYSYMILVPLLAILIVFKDQLLRLIFSGNWSESDIHILGLLIIAQAGWVIFNGMNYILLPAFYALKQRRYLFVTSFGILAFHILFSLLMKSFNLFGLGIAQSTTSVLLTVILVYKLRQKFTIHLTNKTIRAFLPYGIYTGISTLVSVLVFRFTCVYSNMLGLILAVFLFGIVYLIFLKIDQAKLQSRIKVI